MTNNEQKYKTSYFNINYERDINNFAEEFLENISLKMRDFENIIFLCIGTDRSTGDSLGPLIGETLSLAISNEKIKVLGTLERPIHAKNLEDTIISIYSEIEKPLIVAIDACLGKSENIGKITLSNKPIKPGAGANKKLPSVGDISITGIVNDSSFLDINILQNTRLNIVMNMSNAISIGIIYAILKTNKI